MLTKDILVVDDESLMRDTLELSLRSDFIVTKASSGMEALELSDQKLFPVVVLDLRMEGLDGIATLKKLRQKNEHQKVIILTAHQSMDSAIEAINLGAHGYITKPCNFRELKELLLKAHDRYFEEQARAEELRKRLMKMHDDMFSVLCHEFNTPLNGIIGFASILKDELEDEGKQRMAGFIERSAQNLHGIFVEILDHVYSKLPAKSEEQHYFSQVDLATLLDSKREEWNRQFELVGDTWQSEQEFGGCYHSLTAILSKLILASYSESGPAQIAVRHLPGQLVYNITNLDLEARFGFLDDPNSIFSPYIYSISAQRRFDSGVGLHLSTAKNLAQAAGMELIAKKNESGLVDLDLIVNIA